MKFLILNGPNLNLLGQRDKKTYGEETLKDIENLLTGRFPELNFIFVQSNHEGILIDALHEAQEWADGVIVNPGGLMYGGLSLRDAIAAMPGPTIEVHISNVYAREPYRHHSIIADACAGQISGLGWLGYLLALEWHLRQNEA